MKTYRATICHKGQRFSAYVIASHVVDAMKIILGMVKPGDSVVVKIV